jgi:hypothetical protein
MYRKFDVTGNLFLHSVLLNETKHSLQRGGLKDFQ